MSFDKISAATDKHAETFGFTDDERAVILQQAENAGYTWGTTNEPNITNYPKQLEQLKKKEANLFLHASTLTEYIKVKRIPRGLRSTLMPMLLKNDTTYQQKWLALCNRHSLDLMLLTVQHLHQAVQSVKEEIATLDIEFKNSSPATDYNRTHDELKINIDKLRDQLMQNKLRKFERDMHDYQQDRVYTWATERSKYRTFKGRRNPNVNTSERSTTESDSQDNTDSSTNTSKNKKPFLFKTKKTTNEGGGESSAPTTRSKGKIKRN